MVLCVVFLYSSTVVVMISSAGTKDNATDGGAGIGAAAAERAAPRPNTA